LPTTERPPDTRCPSGATAPTPVIDPSPFASDSLRPPADTKSSQDRRYTPPLAIGVGSYTTRPLAVSLADLYVVSFAEPAAVSLADLGVVSLAELATVSFGELSAVT